jgi:hypothetical protein
MGVVRGGCMVAKMENLVARELDLLLREVVLKDASNNDPVKYQLRLDCDISNILHTLAYKYNSVFSTALVRGLASFLKQLAADTGFVVTAVLDGDVRPQSKRDAYKRRYRATMDRINSYYCRQSAMKIASSKPMKDLTNEERDKLDQYNKQAKKLECSHRLEVPNDLKDQLDAALLEIHAYTKDRQSGGYVNNNIIKAEFESDYIIAYRYRHKLSDIIYSTDTDMVALCGKHCISIRSFRDEKNKTKQKRKERANDSENNVAKEYDISLGSNVLMNKMKAYILSNLPENGEDLIKYEKAKYPLFECDFPPLLVGLCMVGIGCDVLPGGVSGVTPLSILNELKKLYQQGVNENSYGEIYRHLVSFYMKKDRNKTLTEVDVRTYVQAFLYQPALEFGKNGEQQPPEAYKYVFHKPHALSSYLKMFAHPTDSGITIDNGEEGEVSILKECNGVHGINLPHSFLQSEGSFTCSSCQVCFCSTCGYSPKKDRDGKKTAKNALVHYDNMNDDLCLECYKQSIFLPFSATLDDILSIDEMRDYLKEKNQSLAHDASPHEVQEMYELCKEEQKRDNSANDNTPYPMYPSHALNIEDGNKYGFGELVHEFDLKDGGLFINSPNIANNMIAPILNLISNVVQYRSNHSDKKVRYTAFDSPIYDVIPSLFVEFANGSRAGNGTGFRLLKRCLRHALDPRTLPLMDQKACLFIHEKDGEMGLVIRNKISASMKEVEYESTIAFTSKDIIATSCECPAGGAKNERAVCVHNLPVMYQLVMLLDDGLAEHILVELCSKWNTDIEQCVKDDDKSDQLRNDIEILMRQSGQTTEMINEAKRKLTIAEMLQTSFATSTQRTKTIPSPPDVKKLRALRDVDFSSVVNKAKKRMKKDDVSEKNNTMSDTLQILKINNGTQTLEPLQCDFCNSGILTTHVCRHPVGNRKIENEQSNICGLASCILCCEENEINRVRCKHHRDENIGTTTTTTTNNTHGDDIDDNDKLLPPDYYDMYCSIKALGFDIENSDFIGFRLLMLRVADTLKAKGERKINEYIENRRRRWTSDFSLTYQRKVPFRPSMKRQPKDTSTNTNIPTTQSTIELSTPKKIWKRGPRKKCCFIKCNNNERTDTNIQRVVDLPKNKPDFAKGRMRDVRRYIKKEMQRKHTLRACAKKDEGGIYFLCNDHETHDVVKSLTISRFGKSTTIKHCITIPTGTSVKNKPTRKSKGLGHERAYNRMVNSINDDIAHLDRTKTKKTKP